MNKTKTVKDQTAAPVSVITDDDLLAPGPSDEVKESTETAALPTAAQPVLPAIPQGATFSAADVAAFVSSAVSAALAAVTQSQNTQVTDLINVFRQQMGPRRLTVAELGEPKTSFNPEGKKRELKKEFYQNGFMCKERFLHDNEIEMLHQLTPGSYGTEELPIAVVEKKQLHGPNRVYIIHGDSRDDRLKMKNYASNFHALLVKLTQEAKEQRAQRRAEARAFLAETDE